ncbi:MAG TPA: nucleotide-binding protein [Longimicrobiaceae bacterium]|nr:nucleotide-binding protein [Longimicrobiaceae bacterium]
MYNLLVSNQLPELGEDPLEISRGRFLEYTSDSIASQLKSLSNEAIAALKSWPCLVMQEGRGPEEAFVAQIVEVGASRSELILRISMVQAEPTIVNGDLWRIRDQLDIEQFEFGRHHWAVKDRNLLQLLGDAGFHLAPEFASRFENRALPAPPRAELLEARRVLSEWSHTELDDFLLEAGVPELSAGRDLGSRHDRANAILRFILDNPSETTAENSLLSAFFRRAALPTDSDSLSSDDGPASAPDLEARAPSYSVERGGTQRSPNRVFVVHGRNGSARTMVVEFLRRVGLEAIVLHEQPNMGRHLLTKFIEEADLVTFAVVLMTADDVGGLTPDELAPRARQNVILELGYFLSHLGQRRICALITPGLETPSDFDGIVYISMDEQGQWQRELERELRAADMPLTRA